MCVRQRNTSAVCLFLGTVSIKQYERALVVVDKRVGTTVPCSFQRRLEVGFVEGMVNMPPLYRSIALQSNSTHLARILMLADRIDGSVCCDRVAWVFSTRTWYTAVPSNHPQHATLEMSRGFKVLGVCIRFPDVLY